MNAQPITLKAFTDAAADAVARAIAGVQRDARQERELRDAEHRARLAELELRLASVSDAERRLTERLAGVRDGEPGADGVSITVADVEPIIALEVGRAVSAIPRPEDGKSITVEDVAPFISERVAEAVSATIERALSQWDRPKDGKSVTVEELVPVVEDAALRAVAALPPAKEGERGPPGDPGEAGRAGKDAEPVTREHIVAAILSAPEALGDAVSRYLTDNPPPGGSDGAAGDRGPEGPEGPIGRDGVGLPGERGQPGLQGERGLDGAPGKLPILKEWTDCVHYEGEVVTLAGSSWQALRDTGRNPSHEDWICVARGGRDGAEGRSFNIRGTWSGAETYFAMDVVVLGGASFAARKDDPGACPGEGWQLFASAGSRGRPGEQGYTGAKGERGPAGPSVVAMAIDGEGLLTLTNGDGSTVDCDLYPVLSKLR